MLEEELLQRQVEMLQRIDSVRQAEQRLVFKQQLSFDDAMLDRIMQENKALKEDNQKL